MAFFHRAGMNFNARPSKKKTQRKKNLLWIIVGKKEKERKQNKTKKNSRWDPLRTFG